MPIKYVRSLYQPKSCFDAAGGAPAFTGPGDVVTSASAWWGLRGYSAAYSTGSNPGIDVVKTSDGSSLTTINILSNGHLDIATISGLGFPVSVKKMYDQTGNGFHLIQATLANMPSLTLSALGSLPAMTFAGSQQLVAGSFSNISQPFTRSMVAECTLDSGIQVVLGNSTGAGFGFRFGSNTTFVLDESGSNVITAAAPVNSFHAVQQISSGTSSSLYTDGSSTGNQTLDTNGITSGFQYFGAANGGNFLTGLACEGGVWPIAFNGTQQSNMNTNQHTYWGF